MGVDRGYEAHFRALWRGEMSFATFAKKTDRLWRRLAAQMRRRWPQPPWHGFEDTVADLLLGAWEFAPLFDPERSSSVQRFVIYNAYDRAKKRCHKARGASHARARGESDNPDRAKSRIDRPLSSYGEEGADDGEVSGAAERLCYSHGVFTAAIAESEMLRDEESDAVRARVWACAETLDEMAVLEVLAEARTIPEAALRLYEDPRTRAELSLRDEDHAREVVSKVCRAVAARITSAA